MMRGNDQNMALIPGRAQGIGSGLHPESDLENTSKLLLAPGIKTLAPCSVLRGDHWGRLSTFRVVSMTYIKRLCRCLYCWLSVC